MARKTSRKKKRNLIGKVNFTKLKIRLRVSAKIKGSLM